MSSRRRMIDEGDGNLLDLNEVKASMSEVDRALFDEKDKIGRPIEQIIVEKRGDIVSLSDKLEISSVGMRVTGELSVDEWRDFFDLVKKVKSSIQWIIGDWCAYGEEKLHWTYEDMVEVTGYTAHSLRQYAYVARNVKMSTRVDTLSFKHHEVVANFPEHEQRGWLEHAVKNKMSYRQLVDSIAGAPTLPSKDPLGAKNFTKNARYIGNLLGRVGGEGSVQPEKAEEAMRRIQAMEQWLEAAKRIIQDKTPN